MPLLDEREIDEHGPDLGVLVVLEGLDANVIEVSHRQPLWRLRARRPRCPGRPRRSSRGSAGAPGGADPRATAGVRPGCSRRMRTAAAGRRLTPAAACLHGEHGGTLTGDGTGMVTAGAVLPPRSVQSVPSQVQVWS